jgi:hypothetical protein
MSDFDDDATEEPSIEELACRIKGIEVGLRQNLVNLHKQLSIIESKPELLSRIASFRRDMETRANDLEEDVKRLREDVKFIKDILGLNLKKTEW